LRVGSEEVSALDLESATSRGGGLALDARVNISTVVLTNNRADAAATGASTTAETSLEALVATALLAVNADTAGRFALGVGVGLGLLLALGNHLVEGSSLGLLLEGSALAALATGAATAHLGDDLSANAVTRSDEEAGTLLSSALLVARHSRGDRARSRAARERALEVHGIGAGDERENNETTENDTHSLSLQ